jgi:hypothetical protein
MPGPRTSAIDISQSDKDPTKDVEPDIPEALKKSMSKPKRPPDYVAIAGEDDTDTPAVEVKKKTRLRDVRPFFKKLDGVLKAGLYRTEIRMVPVRTTKTVNGEKVTEERQEEKEVKVKIAFTIGDDGLPYLNGAVTRQLADEYRGKTYEDAPEMNKTFGDLWPEFVEWLYLNHPYDATVRYFGRNTHLNVNPH